MLTVLVLAAPGPFRQQWLSFLRSISSLELVEIMDCTAALPAAVRVFKPGLVIIDACIFDENGIEAVRRLRADQPGLNCLVLADNLKQMQRARQAGVETVLLRGFSASEFFRCLESLSSDVYDPGRLGLSASAR